MANVRVGTIREQYSSVQGNQTDPLRQTQNPAGVGNDVQRAGFVASILKHLVELYLI